MIGRNTDAEHSFGFWVAVCFTGNYIVGSGFLTLPWAFQRVGVILGTFTLVFFACVATLSAVFVLEAISRAELLLSLRRNEEIKSSMMQRQILLPLTVPVATELILEQNQTGSPNRQSVAAGGADRSSVFTLQNYGSVSDASGRRDVAPLFSLTERPRIERSSTTVLDTAELSDLFYGPRGRHVYCILVSIYMYTVLWAYSCVFAAAFAESLPVFLRSGGTGLVVHDFEASYCFYLFLFACTVTPLCLIELTEQVTVQVVLCAFRVSTMLLMIATAALATSTESDRSDADESSSHWWDCDPSQLLAVLPISAYAFIFQHSVPAIAAPIRCRRMLGRVFCTAIAAVLLLYVPLAATITIKFRNGMLPSANLYWAHYNGVGDWWSMGGGVGSEGYERTSIDFIISLLVVLFPAIDVFSLYPLCTYTLGSNLLSAFYGEQRMEFGRSMLKKRAARIVAALPPYLLAFVVRDLREITQLAGLIGLLLAFTVPAALAWRSRQRLREQGLSGHTEHSNRWFTAQPVVAAVGMTGVVSLVLAAGQLIFGGGLKY